MRDFAKTCNLRLDVFIFYTILGVLNSILRLGVLCLPLPSRCAKRYFAPTCSFRLDIYHIRCNSMSAKHNTAEDAQGLSLRLKLKVQTQR